MRSGLHPVVKHADDFDEVRSQDAIQNHVGWVCDRRLAAFVAAVAGGEASNAGNELGAIDCRTPLWTSCDATHGGGETRPIPDAGLPAVKLFAPPQDRRDVGLCRLGKPISRHAELMAVPRHKVVESGV